MKFALSTNWNNSRLEDGSAIVDEALAIGFDSLELGFRTKSEQLDGFKRRLDEMPVTSVHAYCPIPIGAPSGHPELHQLLVANEDERALARFLLKKTFACAAELGAGTVVFHAGYVDMVTFFSSYGDNAMRAALTKAGLKKDAPVYLKKLAKAKALRAKRGKAMVEMFKKEFELLVPELEKTGCVLALENLPRIEGFPYAEEAEELMRTFSGAPLKLWFDTGHARVRACHGWSDDEVSLIGRLKDHLAGMHINDVADYHDDHRQPGWGKVDFAAMKDAVVADCFLRVFEPHAPVTDAELRESLAALKKAWGESV